MNRLQRVHHALHYISTRRRAANVAGHVRGQPPARPDRRRRLRNYVFTAADEDDVRAERGKSLGYAEADAAAAAWRCVTRLPKAQHEAIPVMMATWPAKSVGANTWAIPPDIYSTRV